MSQPVLNYDIALRLPRPRTLTFILLAALTLTLLTFLAMGLGGALSAHLWTLYAAGRGLSPEEVKLTNGSHEVSTFAFPAVVFTFILLLFWMVDAQRNLRALTAGRLRFSRVDVFMGWILPRVCFIRPFEVMKEIYARSRGLPREVFAPLCGCWWGFLLAANLAALARMLAFSHTELRGADAQIYYADWTVLCAIPYLISGACLAALVYRTDRAQARCKIAAGISGHL